MSKKCICLISIIILLLLFLSGYATTYNWKTIEIENYGSVKVPENWYVSIVDEFMYFSSVESGDNKKILVQYRFGENVNMNFSEIEEFIWLQDENFSNSACIEKARIHYKNGSSQEIFVLRFTGPDNYESTEFICFDNSISENTLRKISKSYEMNT